MTGVVLVETLRRHWRQMLYWGLAVGSIMMLNIVALPDVDALEQMSELLATMPPVMLQMFGMSDLEYMATAEGYLGSQMFSLFVLIIGMYVITTGLNVTANDEESGVMDNMLALPIARWRVITERMIAYALMAVGVVILVFLMAWLALMITPALQVDTGKLAVATLNVLPSAFLVLSFTVLVAAVVRRRSLAMALSISFLAASYLVDNLGRAATGSFLADLRVVSFHTYYDGIEVLRSGLNVGNFIILLVVAVVLAGLSLAAYQRRDVGL